MASRQLLYEPASWSQEAKGNRTGRSGTDVALDKLSKGRGGKKELMAPLATQVATKAVATAASLAGMSSSAATNLALAKARGNRSFPSAVMIGRPLAELTAKEAKAVATAVETKLNDLELADRILSNSVELLKGAANACENFQKMLASISELDLETTAAIRENLKMRENLAAQLAETNSTMATFKVRSEQYREHQGRLLEAAVAEGNGAKKGAEEEAQGSSPAALAAEEAAEDDEEERVSNHRAFTWAVDFRPFIKRVRLSNKEMFTVPKVKVTSVGGLPTPTNDLRFSITKCY
mmetsp:Transcript_15190/g.40032  ORF Transcript_15190/g.40032 Transcript_15190/m.40032 type:complete len:294 (-) Transcript_15190:126-1007(-)